MQKLLKPVLMVLAASALAILAGVILAPFLPPQVIRYITVAIVFGAITYFEEIYIKKNPNPLRKSLLAGGATIVILYLLDVFL